MNKKRGEILRMLAGVACGVAFLSGMMSAAFFLTAFMYTWLGYFPSALLVQIINLLLGLLFGFLILYGIGSLAKSKHSALSMGVFGPIIDAMERIAKGDFSVRLDDNLQDNGVVGTLAKSVNTMALELHQLEVMRQEFISNVSHEIQSPLTSIRGFARALQHDHLSPEERSHYLAIIETESMRLSKLSDNLLKLTSLDSEHITFEPKSYRLDRQIRELILACEPQWADKGIEMDVCLEEVAITADEDLLSQVWINLIHNSVKFTPGGGSVRIELHPQAGHVTFRIIDTGIGIAEEDQAHVFERFFKADTSRDRAKGGNGLGLAIAHKIVDLHHGTISVDSALGAGATFSVCLPIEQSLQSREPRTENRPAKRASVCF
jgi:two-component system, OmpR family, phosphate regulon sensor histidine kinase PhoR